MIYLHFSGGIGNQLFQYAFARNLSILFKDKLSADITRYTKNDKREFRDFLLGEFILEEDISFDAEFKRNNIGIYKLRIFIADLLLKILRWGSNNDRINRQFKINAQWLGLYYFPPTDVVHFKIYKSFCKDKYVVGNWMSEYYFKENVPSIKFKNLKIQETDIFSEISQTNSVCVHIRRGDYLDEKWKFLQVCDFNYFNKAMSKIVELIEKPKFYIFSDDIEWLKLNWEFNYDVVFINNQLSPIDELSLMSNCKNFIMSNSSFSFWGMYLSKNKNKIVIAPSYWHSDKSKTPIYMETWILVNPEEY